MTDYLHVPGAQVTTAEREFIKNQAALLTMRVGGPTPVFVNIGILWAATMWCLREGAPRATLYGVDIKLDKNIHRRNALNATFIEGDSRYEWKKFKKDPGLPIDLLLIDGDHHYSTVRLDIAGWTPLVSVGGVVIFHDYAPTSLNLRQFPHIAGVRQAVDEWYSSSLGANWESIKNTPDSLRAFRRTA